MEKGDAVHLGELFTGEHAMLFWSVQLLGLVIPITLVLFSKMRKPVPLLIISVFVIIGAWLKRFIIVIPTLEHPYLPKQYVPEKWMHYQPTMPEISITVASFILVLFIITILSKFFPVVPIWEMAEEEQNKNEINE